MKKNKVESTNATRILDKNKVKFELIDVGIDEAMSGIEVADLLGELPDVVYKTLVTVAKSKEHYVFMIPSEKKLDLKKAAKVVGEKSLEPIKQKDLLPLTGYVHGGCSPIGMKKQFKTFIHCDALRYDYIYFSAGKIGKQVKTSVEELKRVITLTEADITE